MQLTVLLYSTIFSATTSWYSRECFSFQLRLITNFRPEGRPDRRSAQTSEAFAKRSLQAENEYSKTTNLFGRLGGAEGKNIPTGPKKPLGIFKIVTSWPD